MTKKCARWCGAGCTQEQYDHAVKAATVLAKRMGRGWKPQVWENMGWHYCVVSKNGFIKIHPGHDWQKKHITHYTAFIGEKGAGGRWAESGRNPAAALKAAVTVAEKEAAAIASWLKDAS